MVQRETQKHSELWHHIDVGAHQCHVQIKPCKSCNDELSRKLIVLSGQTRRSDAVWLLRAWNLNACRVGSFVSTSGSSSLCAWGTEICAAGDSVVWFQWFVFLVLPRTSRFASFPEYLVVQIKKFTFGLDWIPKKLGMRLFYLSFYLR